jgi:hypothetical protein
MANAKAKAAGRAQKQDPEQQLRAGLARAMMRAYGMSQEDAAEVAGTVADQFAGKEEVNDDTIAADLRSLFYTLEAKRLMSFRRIEYDNEEGEKRRAFFWKLRAEVVQQLALPDAEPTNEDVYHALPAECWRRETAAKA